MLKINLLVLEWRLYGITSSLISRIVGLTRKSVYLFLRNLSYSSVSNYYLHLPKIEGESTIVEIDVSKFGKRKYYRGHRVEEIGVLE